MRGAWPENTLPGFAAAIDVGVDVLELDIVSTAEGIFIVHHDLIIQPSQFVYLDGSPVSTRPLVSSLTLSQIKQLDRGSIPDPDFPRQIAIPKTQIPTLEEVFELLRSAADKEIRLNVEIKREPRLPKLTLPAKELASRLVAQVQQSGLSHRVDYYSFDPEVLYEIRQLEPEATIGFLFTDLFLDASFSFEERNEILLSYALRLDADILSLDYEFLRDREQVRSYQRRGFKIVAWTVNKPEEWLALLDKGVNSIVTDYPEDLIDFLSLYDEELKASF
jgi:glycerophosphoryl diester phosphodiesterase